MLIRWCFLLSVIFLINHSSADDLRELDWEKTVLYQIYPRSFQDSDGDGTGDLKGIISRLQHLKDAGIGATWLSPIYKSSQHDSGYDIVDFFDIDPQYGTMEDFENMLQEAKKIDIKIIMDFVPNHSSDECEWFIKSLNKSSEYADWYVWADGHTDEEGKRLPPNNWVGVFRKSAWEYREERNQFYFHQFVVQQPDFNFRNPAVIKKMKEIIRFWLQKGVAGFRIGAINHLFEVNKDDFNGEYPDEPRTGDSSQGPDDYGYLDHIYTKNRNESYWMVYEWRSVFEEFTQRDGLTRIMMTEAYFDIKNTMRYYGNETGEGSHIPFNFGIITDVNKYSSAKDIKHITDRWFTYMPMGKTANWVIGNHDQWRVGTRYGPQRIDSLNMIATLLPGIAVTYNGEEIGMLNTNITWEDTQDPMACNTDDPINYWDTSRDAARTPFQWNNGTNAGFSTGNKTWLPVNENYMTINLEHQKEAERSHYKIYQACVALRSMPTFSHGKYKSMAFNDEVFAFERSLSGYDTYAIVINLSKKEQVVDLTCFSNVKKDASVVVANMESLREIGDKIDANAVKLIAYEALVLS